MKMFLLIGLAGVLLAMLPVWIALLGGLLGWAKGDPSWGAALPALLFFTVPAGLVVSLIGWAIQFAYSMWG